METAFFKNFDFSSFWNDDSYALKNYVGNPPTNDLILSIEEELGYELPASYIELMKMHNGGIPINTCFPTNQRTSWASDHIAISGIMGIGRSKDYSLCGSLGSKLMIEEWGYPAIGIYICDCPSAGHDMILLDYSDCGREGEPMVVHIAEEFDYKKTFLAKDFETFILSLVNQKEYETSTEKFKKTLQALKTGAFSDILQQFFSNESSTNFDRIFRKILIELTQLKGYFALHADELSELAYDIQFYLFTKYNIVQSRKAFLENYSQMIAFGNNEISTEGYAPAFVEDWFNKRTLENNIIKKPDGNLGFCSIHERLLMEQIKKYDAG